MKDVILIPTYNEKENIQHTIACVFNYVTNVEIVVIDDNSPDGTRDIVREMQKKDPRIFLLERDKKEGLGAAYKSAIANVLLDKDVRTIITMDADGSHDPIYLPEFYKLLQTYDLVVGSRYVKGGGVQDWEAWRLMLSRFGNIYSRMLTNLNVRDLTAGFVGVRRDILEKIDWSEVGSTGYAYQIEFKYHCIKEGKSQVVETPILFKNRREGESKISNHIIREGLKTPFKLFIKKWQKTRI